MENISVRLKQIIDCEGDSIRAFEMKSGITIGVIQKAINGNKDVRSNVLTKILLTNPQYSGEWLLTGEGEMLKKTRYSNNSQPLKVAEPYSNCPYCKEKDKRIKDLELHRDDLRAQVKLLEFNLGKNLRNGSA